MKAALQTQTQAPAPTFFTPVHARLLQRSCASGGSAGVAGECEEGSQQKLSLYRSTRDSEPENRRLTTAQRIASPGRTFDAEAGESFGPLPGHDFGRLAVSGMPALQTKLAISQPGDAFEREADTVAEQIMRMPFGSEVTSNAPPTISRWASQENSARISRQTEEQDPEVEELLDESSLLSMKSIGESPAPSANLRKEVLSMRGGGEPLAPELRNFFEPRFGHDFSAVRVHTDSRAAQTTRALNARAFTLGHDVAVAPGEYEPETQAGRLLLAHELTHVVQQADQVQTLMRACDCPAMGATAPPGSVDTFLRSKFPQLVTSDYCVTAPATKTYNCIAWSISDTSRWVWDEVDGYGNRNGTVDISDFDAFYDLAGLKPVTDATPSNAQVALYAVGTTPKHAARKTGAACGGWESKLGTNVRIAHLPNQLEGGSTYGDINRYYVPK